MDFGTYWKLTNVTGIAGANDTADNFGGLDYPKYKFNYTVQFILSRDVALKESGNTKMEEMKFAVKTATRPKPAIDYQDVNFYNFRTKVAVKAEYGTASISFYDDNKDRAHDILQNYLQAVSPISNFQSSNNLDNLGQSSTSSIGPLTRDRHGPISAIVLTHYYNNGKGVVNKTYTYRNPRIINFDFDELDMTNSEPATLSITFNYDMVNIT